MRKVFACLLAAVILSANPAAAQDNSGAEAKADVDPTDRQTHQYYDLMADGRYAEALTAIEDIKPGDDNREGQAVLSAMRASALYALKRDAEARRLMAKADELAAQSPGPTEMLFFESVVSERFDVAADAFDKLLAKFPEAAREQSWDVVRYFLSHEPKGQEQRSDDRRVALARIGYGGDTDIGHWRVAAAIDILMRRGEVTEAGNLLPRVNEPEAFENMLVQRRYEPLWPQLQGIGGPHLEKIRAAEAASAQRSLLTAPDDPEKLQRYINALRHSGRFDDAIALRSKLPTTRDGMAAADEQTGWAVNNLAYALYEAGKADESDQLLAMLNEAPMKDDSWRISMIINRLEMLVGGGRFEKAAKLLDATEYSAKTSGSPYAKQLVRRLRYCILASTGKKGEAATALAEMLKHSDDAPQATIDALLCGGEIAKAEELALAALKNPDQQKRSDFEEAFVRSMQPVALTSDDPSVWQGRWGELRKRPAIAKEYDRLGRDMPADLLPPKADAAKQ